ncbi:hypothetical protein TWF225_005491 [Orbilia oligospora]|nr:hypothetical protein TWF225_005491 [Orbilia oligospora]KAF3259878.1 hypothetical protein TWF128_003870 [Orbilia oligospora]KAF3270812.1 hypothetical protein TWF217_007087 [Orbilia oligospora]KAF3292298.1 hypothetical protein TWF132_005688 [Orbilia oligospora]
MSKNNKPAAQKKRNFFEAFAKSKAPVVESSIVKKQVLEYAPKTTTLRSTTVGGDIGNDGDTLDLGVLQMEHHEGKEYIDSLGQSIEEGKEEEGEEEESTDFKLALLSSLQPSLSPETLLELLLTCNGSVSSASKLASSSSSSLSPSKKQSTSIPTQSSLSTFLSPFQDPNQPHNPPSQTTRKIPFPLPAIPKFKTLHLTTPSQVPYYTPATLHPSFLPPDTANQLLRECLAEAPSFGKYEFRLFERNVSSPHTASFFVKDEEMAIRHRRGYMYNGSVLDDIRTFTPTMHKIIPHLESFIRSQLSSRISTVYPHGQKLKHMLPPQKWHITSAFMNCYDGAKQSVGWHSDQLTYLGPRTVIASISLGVEREFRLRRVAPVVIDTTVPFEPDSNLDGKGGEEEKEGGSAGKQWKWQPEGQASIHLPHNSLLIMHAECQESWKHSIHPANNIQPHPIAGGKRINITFRCYRESLRPDKIPKCKCGVGCVLKTVQRVKERMGWYFWGCQVGNQWKDGDNDDNNDNYDNDGEGKGKKKEGGCGYLVWAKFDDDGDPIWE